MTGCHENNKKFRNYAPQSLVPCITLNRPDTDTEILCGVYTADCRSSGVHEEYVGLSDDPANYSFSIHNRRITIEYKDSKKSPTTGDR